VNPRELLRSVETILVIDWPSKDVPESLVRAGIHVVVRGGPGPADYSVYELNDSVVEVRHPGHAPDHADLVYSYRPLGELPGIVTSARSLVRQGGLGVNQPGMERGGCGNCTPFGGVFGTDLFG